MKKQNLKSTKPIEIERRKFLKQSLMSLSGLSMAAVNGFGSKSLFAAGLERRRHLINIPCAGGWDSFWFHGHFPSQEIREARAQLPAGEKPKYTTRFNDESPFNHPIRSDMTIGLGLRHLYSDDDLRNILIWRGIGKDADHIINNQIIQHGTISSYAVSYSSLIAEQLAVDRKRPLHFVQISDSPQDLFTNSALAMGYQVPVNIASQDIFRSVTSLSPGELPIGRRGLVDLAISQLTQLALSNRIELKRSKVQYEAFLSNLKSVSLLSKSGYADSNEFKAIWARMTILVLDSIRSFLSRNDDVCAKAAVDPVTGEAKSRTTLSNYVSGLSSVSTANSVLSKLSTTAGELEPFTNIDDLLKNESLRTRLIADFNILEADSPSAFGICYGPAMSYFLIKNDLSAVVEFGLPVGDYHDLNHGQLAVLTGTFSAYRELLRALRGTPLNDGSGKSLNDITTTVMHTEFDRMAWLSNQNEANVNQPGTEHGLSVSLLMAGYGVDTSKGIVGDIKTATGPYGKYGSMFSKNVYLTPLPVDLKTGLPSSSGAMLSSKSIAPTILSIFDTPVPLAQITDYGVVPAVRKS